MKHISILGSTGSIGENTLKVVRHLGKDAIKVVGLAAKSNIELLEQQAKEFHPEIIAVFEKDKALLLQKKLPHIRVLGGVEGLKAVASYSSTEMVISAMTGTIGLVPTLAAVEAGKNVGLANKEALISGGALIMSLAKQKNIQIIPIDSEHSAIFQCLNGEDRSSIHKLILTASGGPFRSYSDQQLQQITPEQALNHPTWSMGPKVTIDSSTLMNKGLEVIEAHWLFDVPSSKIDVIIHPQSIIHSMVEFVDNSLLAQMGETSMITPIQYAITYPERCQGSLQRFDFMKHPTLQFYAPDFKKFRCLQMAYYALEQGKSLPCYMNAANEVLVHKFLNREISWQNISIKLEQLMTRHSLAPITSLDDIISAEALAREEATRL